MPDSTAWALWVGCAPRSSPRAGAVQRGSLTKLVLLLLWLGKRLLDGWCMCLCAGHQAQGVDGAGTIAVLPSPELSPLSVMGQHRVQCAGRGWQHPGTAGKPRSGREHPSTRCV